MPLPEIFWQLLLGLYTLAAFVQLVAWWGVFGKIGLRPIHQSTNHQSTNHQSTNHQSTNHQSTNHQSTSILLCARNEAENLSRYLPAVLAQQYESEWELLVVDDASEDETPDVLRSFQEKNPERMRVLTIEKKTFQGKKNALARGISAAKYDLFLLTDADCEPASPRWLAHMAAMLTAKPEIEIVLGYGPMSQGEKDPSSSFLVSTFSRYETAFVAAQYFSLARAGMPYMGVGRNLAFKRSIFDRVGGFSAHAHIISGDDDLLVNASANARNTAICLTPESFVYSNSPTSWPAWLLQKQRHLAAGTAYRWPHKILLAMLGLSQIGFYFLFAVLVLVGFAPEIVLGVFLLRLFSVLFVFGKILRVLRDPGLWWQIPLLDPLMAVYYGVVVPWVLVGKKRVGWR